MLKQLRINTAVILSTAFIFRLLFINIGIITSLNSHQHSGLAKNHFEYKMKRKRQAEASANTGGFASLAAEICEENSGEDSQLKSNPLVPIHVLYTFVAGNVSDALQKFTRSHTRLCYPIADRYLTCRAFRI